MHNLKYEAMNDSTLSFCKWVSHLLTGCPIPAKVYHFFKHPVPINTGNDSWVKSGALYSVYLLYWILIAMHNEQNFKIASKYYLTFGSSYCAWYTFLFGMKMVKTNNLIKVWIVSDLYWFNRQKYLLLFWQNQEILVIVLWGKVGRANLISI